MQIEADFVEALAHEAGRVAMQFFGQTGLSVESKGQLDPVTQADRAVERLIVKRLSQTFPDEGIVGEEGASATSRSGRTWAIDPIDGTLNFIRGSDQWSISIGLLMGQGLFSAQFTYLLRIGWWSEASVCRPASMVNRSRQ